MVGAVRGDLEQVLDTQLFRALLTLLLLVLEEVRVEILVLIQYLAMLQRRSRQQVAVAVAQMHLLDQHQQVRQVALVAVVGPKLIRHLQMV